MRASGSRAGSSDLDMRGTLVHLYADGVHALPTPGGGPLARTRASYWGYCNGTSVSSVLATCADLGSRMDSLVALAVIEDTLKLSYLAHLLPDRPYALGHIDLDNLMVHYPSGADTPRVTKVDHGDAIPTAVRGVVYCPALADRWDIPELALLVGTILETHEPFRQLYHIALADDGVVHPGETDDDGDDEPALAHLLAFAKQYHANTGDFIAGVLDRLLSLHVDFRAGTMPMLSDQAPPPGGAPGSTEGWSALDILYDIVAQVGREREREIAMRRQQHASDSPTGSTRLPVDRMVEIPDDEGSGPVEVRWYDSLAQAMACDGEAVAGPWWPVMIDIRTNAVVEMPRAGVRATHRPNMGNSGDETDADGLDQFDDDEDRMLD